MMATPAEVANDLAALARALDGRIASQHIASIRRACTTIRVLQLRITDLEAHARSKP